MLHRHHLSYSLAAAMLIAAALSPVQVLASNDNIDWDNKRDAARAHSSAIKLAWGMLSSWIERRPRGSDPDLTQVRGPHLWRSGSREPGSPGGHHGGCSGRRQTGMEPGVDRTRAVLPVLFAGPGGFCGRAPQGRRHADSRRRGRSPDHPRRRREGHAAERLCDGGDPALHGASERPCGAGCDVGRPVRLGRHTTAQRSRRLGAGLPDAGRRRRRHRRQGSLRPDPPDRTASLVGSGHGPLAGPVPRAPRCGRVVQLCRPGLWRGDGDAAAAWGLRPVGSGVRRRPHRQRRPEQRLPQTDADRRDAPAPVAFLRYLVPGGGLGRHRRDRRRGVDACRRGAGDRRLRVPQASRLPRRAVPAEPAGNPGL